MSKRRIQIRELQKQELHQKVERILLIRLHIFYLILLINLYTKNEIVNNKILQNKNQYKIYDHKVQII